MPILLDQIQYALAHNFYFVALMAALAVPDIAGALDSVDGLASPSRYAAWYDKYARPMYRQMLIERIPVKFRASIGEIKDSPMTGEACYQFRCSLLHQGSTKSSKSKFERIIFIQPMPGASTIHYSSGSDDTVLIIDLPSFCLEIVWGANVWLAAVQETETFQRNYARFARVHPEGLDPYIGGVPVIG